MYNKFEAKNIANCISHRLRPNKWNLNVITIN